MNIRPSASIRQNYNEISELCKKSGEPVYLTKNGEGDLVVMDIASFERREKMLKLREELLAVEEDRLHGEKGYSVSDVSEMMRPLSERQSMMEMNKTYSVIVRGLFFVVKLLKSTDICTEAAVSGSARLTRVVFM